MKLNGLIILFFLFLSCNGNSQEVTFNIDQKSWQADFQFLKRKVEKTVPTYQIPENKKAFDEVYNIISNSDVGNTKEDIIFALQHLLNTLNDEGCNVPFFQKGVELELLPIKTYWFDDGLYVLAASENYKDVIGQQIIKINNTSVEEVFDKLKTVLNADNDYYKKYLFQAYGFMPLILKIMHLGQSDDEITLQFASGETKTMKNSSINEYASLSRGLPNNEVFSLTNTEHKSENYWLEMIPNSKAVFVQLQRIENEEEVSFSEFTNQIKSLIEQKKVDKIIIDLRYGGGGNGFKLKGLTDLLKNAEAINKKGNLFVLTSKATRGTLLELASILRLNTKAIIIGEPTAEGVNTVGDINYITLPNSGIKVSLTHTFWPTSWEKDTSTFMQPDVKVQFSYTDRVEARDSWLETINRFKAEDTNQSIPSNLINQFTGTYKVEGRKISIKNVDGRLFLTMNRKMKSFFEIQTELYLNSEGVLSTDIDGVKLNFTQNDSKEVKLESLKWKQLILKIE